MTIAELILLVLKVSIVLVVFGLGLKATFEDMTYLFRRPGQLIRSLLSMNVLMPVFATMLALAFDLHPAVKIALVALAVSPVPPLLPKKAIQAGGNSSYTIGLLVAAALFAIVSVPLAMELLQRVFETPLAMSSAAVAQLVLMMVIVPLAIGILVRYLSPAFADRIAKPITLLAMILLVAAVLPVLFTAWPAVRSLIGNGTLLAIAAFVLVGLAVGHLLGGPDADDRIVLALSTASRHPGIAIAIAQANFPEQKLAVAAVLLYLIVNAIVAIPYLNWIKRRHAGVGGAVAT
ncbi:MAG: Na+-dependent transporter [Acidobacteria bacterium]|nr:Na+-dependent transporter [Acidobacteriota bacterium]